MTKPTPCKHDYDSTLQCHKCGHEFTKDEVEKPTPEEKKEAVVKCAIYWKKVYSFEIEPKPGKDYELKYRTL